MAISFPLPLSTFANELRVVGAEFYLPPSTVHSATRAGEIITTDLGTRLWKGSFRLATMKHADADSVSAFLELLGRGDASFLISPLHRLGTIDDPDGETLIDQSPKLLSVAANNKEIRISGLTDGTVLSRGDFLSFTYGSNPVRYAFHRVVTGGIAGANGETPLLEVVPHIRSGWVTNSAVRLFQPVYKAKATSISSGDIRSIFSDGMSIEFTQTLR